MNASNSQRKLSNDLMTHVIFLFLVLSHTHLSFYFEHVECFLFSFCGMKIKGSNWRLYSWFPSYSLTHKSYRHEASVACSVSKWFADQNWRHNRVLHAESNIWASCTRTLLQWFADQKYHRNRAAHKLIFEQVRLFLSSFSSRNSHNKMIAALSCP